MNGHWKIFLTDGKIIDDKNAFTIDTQNTYYKILNKEKTKVLYLISINSFSYSKWIESK